jgi:predicted RecA/RadA family phage recombinase
MITSFAAAHRAGDLVFENGWFGVVEETVAAATRGYIITEGGWLLPRVPATVAMGARLYGLPTADATTIALQTTTAGTHFAVGRTLATGNATVAKVVLFGEGNTSY